jgi:hypothetical protein
MADAPISAAAFPSLSERRRWMMDMQHAVVCRRTAFIFLKIAIIFQRAVLFLPQLAPARHNPAD